MLLKNSPQLGRKRQMRTPHSISFFFLFGSLLDLPEPEEYAKVPSKIFGSKDRKKKQQSVRTCLFLLLMKYTLARTVKESCWNPLENDECLLSATFNIDMFLPNTRPVMRFYRTTSKGFSTTAPRCLDSLQSIMLEVSTVSFSYFCAN